MRSNGPLHQVKEYKDKFKELKMAFQDCAILHTEITVSCVMDNLESLGELFQLANDCALLPSMFAFQLWTLMFMRCPMPRVLVLIQTRDVFLAPVKQSLKRSHNGLMVLMETMSLGFFP
jgi:hypothetical protein